MEGTLTSKCRGVVRAVWLASLLLSPFLAPGNGPNATTATLTIDTNTVENVISPSLYGQFAEFMFQDIKGGLDAELVRDRGFDEQSNALGLPRYWERDPDDRNDDAALRLAWDADVYLAVNGDKNTLASQHSLRVDVQSEFEQRRGVHQGWIPVRAGIDYEGYIWLKSADYVGKVVIALEADQTDGEEYASAVLPEIAYQAKGNCGSTRFPCCRATHKAAFATTSSNEWRLYTPPLFDGLGETLRRTITGDGVLVRVITGLSG